MTSIEKKYLSIKNIYDKVKKNHDKLKQAPEYLLVVMINDDMSYLSSSILRKSEEQNATVSLNINDYFNPDEYDYSFSISIYGSLRDRSIKETLKEYNNFLQKVDSFFTVTDHMYKIDNDRFKTLIYTSSKKKKKIIIDSEDKMFKRLDENLI